MTACLATALLSGCASNSLTDARDSGWNHYGNNTWDSGREVALGELGGSEHNIVVQGTIKDVCAEKGCWMNVVDDEGNEIFVRFKDYSFFVPRNAAGHRVTMHGWTKNETLSVATLRHFAEDAGKSEAEIAAITEPAERITFYADSVYIEGEGLDAPHSE